MTFVMHECESVCCERSIVLEVYVMGVCQCGTRNAAPPATGRPEKHWIICENSYILFSTQSSMRHECQGSTTLYISIKVPKIQHTGWTGESDEYQIILH